MFHMPWRHNESIYINVYLLKIYNSLIIGHTEVILVPLNSASCPESISIEQVSIFSPWT